MVVNNVDILYSSGGTIAFTIILVVIVQYIVEQRSWWAVVNNVDILYSIAFTIILVVIVQYIVESKGNIACNIIVILNANNVLTMCCNT